jgi:biotin carboxyl carrier protein
MYSVKVNEKYGHKIVLDGNTPQLDGVESANDIVQLDAKRWHVISGDRSYHAELIKAEPGSKEYIIRINGNKYQVQLKDEMDQLLEKMGLDKMASAKVNEIKAPMPGLVLKALVNKGDSVNKGDGLLVLEAMKMENVIKSPSAGVIKSIEVKVGSPVEKNQVLIQFE